MAIKSHFYHLKKLKAVKYRTLFIRNDEVAHFFNLLVYIIFSVYIEAVFYYTFLCIARTSTETFQTNFLIENADWIGRVN